MHAVECKGCFRWAGLPKKACLCIFLSVATFPPPSLIPSTNSVNRRINPAPSFLDTSYQVLSRACFPMTGGMIQGLEALTWASGDGFCSPLKECSILCLQIPSEANMCRKKKRFLLCGEVSNHRPLSGCSYTWMLMLCKSRSCHGILGIQCCFYYSSHFKKYEKAGHTTTNAGKDGKPLAGKAWELCTSEHLQSGV